VRHGAELLGLDGRDVLVELHVFLGPLGDALEEALLAPPGVHEDDVVLGILEPRKVPLEELHRLRRVDLGPAVVEAAEAELEVAGKGVVGVVGELELVLGRVVRGELLVDALVVLEHLVPVEAREGVEVVVDLVLEHVLREGGKDGHLCRGGGYIQIRQWACSIFSWKNGLVYLSLDGGDKGLDLLNEGRARLSDPHALAPVVAAGTEACAVTHEEIFTELATKRTRNDKGLARLLVLKLALTATPHAIARHHGDDDAELSHRGGCLP
jgi:hypothetical protein